MRRSHTSSFKVQLECPLHSRSVFLIERLLSCGHSIYNYVLGRMLKNRNRLNHDKRFRELLNEKRQTKDPDKLVAIRKEISELANKHGFTEAAAYKLATELVKKSYPHPDQLYPERKRKSKNKKYKSFVGTQIAQNLASRAFMAVQNLQFGKATQVHFKKQNEKITISGNRNGGGLQFEVEKDETGAITHCALVICDERFTVHIRRDDKYLLECLACNRIKYVSVWAENIRGRRRQFMHLTFEGPKPKTKAQKKTQGKIHAREIETRIPYAQQKARGDAGLSTFALVSDYDAKFIELYPEHAREDKHKKALQQAIERSIRANNPDNYNADGTYKKRFERKPWKISNRQRKLRQKYKDKCRKVRIRCQESHRKNANDLAAAAGKMLIEPMHWQGMAKHSSKPTEINEKTGKCKRKRRFGRSITQKAPARFIKYLKEAIQLQGGTVEEVNSHKVKATQYNPATGEYKKHTILERWIELPLFKIFVQRDLLSAYNLKCVDEGLQSAETPESWKGLDNFIKMHDKLISELLKSPKLTKRLFWYIRRRPEFN